MTTVGSGRNSWRSATSRSPRRTSGFIRCHVYLPHRPGSLREFLNHITPAGANIVDVDFDDQGRRPHRLTLILNVALPPGDGRRAGRGARPLGTAMSPLLRPRSGIRAERRASGDLRNRRTVPTGEIRLTEPSDRPPPGRSARTPPPRRSADRRGRE